MVYRVKTPLYRRPAASLVSQGNLAPEGAIVKVAGIAPDQQKFRGPVRVFDREEDAFAYVSDRKVKPGECIVIRYEGPKGRSRHARDVIDHRSALRPRHRERGPHHRRALLRRHPRPLRRPCRPRGGGRRPDRPTSRRRYRGYRRHHRQNSRSNCPTRNSPNAAQVLDARAKTVMPPVRSGATPRRSAQRRTAQCATREPRRRSTSMRTFDGTAQKSRRLNKHSQIWPDEILYLT